MSRKKLRTRLQGKNSEIKMVPGETEESKAAFKKRFLVTEHILTY